MPRHRHTLDQILSLVVTPLVRTFGVLDGYERLNPNVPLAAFLLAAEHRPDITRASALLAPPHGAGRGGPWLKLVRAGVGVLRLNTPAEATALLDAQAADVEERRKQVEKASKPFDLDAWQSANVAAAAGAQVLAVTKGHR